MPPVEALVRRAKTAGIAGWIAFAIGVLGFALLPGLRYLWIVVGFLGLGSVLRGVALTAAAAARRRNRS